VRTIRIAEAKLARGFSGLAEAAARSEVEQLKRELAAKQLELDAAQGALAGPVAVSGPGTVGGASPGGGTAGNPAVTPARLWTWGLSIPLALACGFWLGYAALARRIRHKFGGIKVY